MVDKFVEANSIGINFISKILGISITYGANKILVYLSTSSRLSYHTYRIFGMVASESSLADLILHDPGKFGFHYFFYH